MSLQPVPPLEGQS